jgi:hypothetical protein
MTQITDKQREILKITMIHIIRDMHVVKGIFDTTTDCETPNGRELEDKIHRCLKDYIYIQKTIPLI